MNDHTGNTTTTNDNNNRSAWSSTVENALEDNPLLLRYRRARPQNLQGGALLLETTTTSVHQHEVSSHNHIVSSPVASWTQQIRRHLFFARLLQQYQLGCQTYSWNKFFRHDLLAGFTTAVLSVPLSMSYAKLAGLPAYVGLYASMIPPMVFPLLSTSRQMAVGPAALVCLILSNGIPAILEHEGLSQDDDEEVYNARYSVLAIQCSMLVGIIYLIVGLCRLGFLTQLFLSKAVISGFTSGAAVLIALSQLKYLLGITIVPSARQAHQIVQGLIRNMDGLNWRTMVLGLAGIAIIVTCKHVSTRYPKYSWTQAIGPFVVTALSIGLTAGLDLNVPTVEAIPRGLPVATVQWWTPLSNDLWIIALSIAVVGYVQSFAIAKRFAYKHGYELESSQELLALGLTNLLGGAFQAFPVSGALGQSAVNDSIGAQTGVASVVTGVAVLLVLLLLTPVFERMPLAALGAIVISYVVSMFDYQEAIFLYKVHTLDLIIWFVAFNATLFLGVELGLALAVTVSLLLVVYQAALPHTSTLGRLPGTSVFDNIKQQPTLELYKGVVVVRINVPLIFFANAVPVRDKIRKYKDQAIRDLEQNDGQLRPWIPAMIQLQQRFLHPLFNTLYWTGRP